jgi:hypothetical protein
MDGLVAEWLRRGLQILVSRFDSGRGLQFPKKARGKAVDHPLRHAFLSSANALNNVLASMESVT